MITKANRYIARTFTPSGARNDDKEYYVFDSDLKWIKKDEKKYFGSEIQELFRRCDVLNEEDKLYKLAIEEFIHQ